MSQTNLYLAHKVVIKCARHEDLPDLFEMVDSYNGELNIDRKKTKNNLREMLYNRGVFIGTLNGKAIGGVAAHVFPCMFNNDLMFCVMFFFVKNGHRHLTKEFLRELELVLTPTKITKIIFGFLAGKEQRYKLRFMRMLGYKVFETHVYKNI